MKKKGMLLILVIGIFLSLLSLSFVSAVCTGGDSQLILKLSSETNAHGEVWNGSGNYPIEICYDEIFGVSYTGANPHSCTATNTILKLSNTTNAHAEVKTLSNYDTKICYGDLSCVSGTSCSPEYTPVLSLSSLTNAHLSSNSNYPVKICCKAGAPGGNLYWVNMLGVKIGKEDDGTTLIAKAQVEDTVGMVVENLGMPGTQVNFEIYEKDGILNADDEIRTVSEGNAITATVDANGNAFAKWTIDEDDLLKTEDDYTQFVFRVNTAESNELEIEDIPDNSLPDVFIDYPSIELPVEQRRFIINNNINFKQKASDEDDDLEIEWAYGDGDTELIQNCLTPGINCNSTHTYSTHGVKVIGVTAREMGHRQFEAWDDSKLFIYRQGINLFANISEPEYNKVFAPEESSVHVNGRTSYIANCTLNTCPAIPTELSSDTSCYDVSDETTTYKCFNFDNTKRGSSTFGIWFKWGFDIGAGRTGKWENTENPTVDDNIVDFYHLFTIPGNHWVNLTIGYKLY